MFTDNCIKDWECGINHQRETKLAQELIFLFNDFLKSIKIATKSKSTRLRYKNSLHALGGHIIGNSISDNDKENALTLLFKSITPYDGPLIYTDNEKWQKEIDLVCRKLFKYLDQKSIQL